VLTESKRLADETHRARRQVAGRVAAGLGLPAKVVLGRTPPIRRIRTDTRTGRDLDELHGRSAVTPELLAYWQHRKDIVFPAVEAMYRAAAERKPYSEPLVSAARAHISVLRERRSMLSEGGDALEAALGAYDQSFENLRTAVIDSQDVATEAIERLASLKRLVAEAELGDGPDEKGFIAGVLGSMSDLPIDTEGMPYVPVADTGSTQVRSSLQPPSSSTPTTYGGSERKRSWKTSSSWRSVTSSETPIGTGSAPPEEYDEASLRSSPLYIRSGTGFS
jgi:hypothetical protein